MLEFKGTVILDKIKTEQIQKKDGSGVFNKTELFGSVVTGWQQGASSFPVAVQLSENVVNRQLGGSINQFGQGSHMYVEGYCRGNPWNDKVIMSLNATTVNCVQPVMMPGSNLQQPIPQQTNFQQPQFQQSMQQQYQQNPAPQPQQSMQPVGLDDIPF